MCTYIRVYVYKYVYIYYTYVCMHVCMSLFVGGSSTFYLFLASDDFFQFSQGQPPGGVRFGNTIVASGNMGVFSHAEAFGFWILIMVPHISGYYNPSKNLKKLRSFMALLDPAHTLGFLMSANKTFTKISNLELHPMVG